MFSDQVNDIGELIYWVWRVQEGPWVTEQLRVPVRGERKYSTGTQAGSFIL